MSKLIRSKLDELAEQLNIEGMRFNTKIRLRNILMQIQDYHG